MILFLEQVIFKHLFFLILLTLLSSYTGIIIDIISVLYIRYDDITGVRHDEFGVTSVHSRRRLQKYDPFILASQAEKVCYIRYPRVKNKKDPWITVTKINPRGGIYGVFDHDPLQQSKTGFIGSIDNCLQVDLVVDFTAEGDNEVFEDSENEIDEFGEDSDSANSENSSESE